MDPIQRNLQATQNLLSALEQDPTLLDDDDFIQKLAILRSKHEETTSYLASKVGSSFPTRQWENIATSSTATPSAPVPQPYQQLSHHQDHYHQSCSSTAPQSIPTTKEFDRNYNISLLSSSHYPPSNHSNISNTSPSIPHYHNGSSSRFAQYSSSAASSSQYPPSTVIHLPRNSANFATSSHVVEENYYDDGMSTTREIPTIIDEIVGQEGFELKFPEYEEPKEKPVADILPKPRRTTSMHNISKRKEAVKKLENNNRKELKSKPKNQVKEKETFRPHITIPQPFQLTMRKSIENTYAKKFMGDLIIEKKNRELEDDLERKSQKFKAKPVPETTYIPQNNYLNDDKYVAAMRRKVAAAARRKFEQQNDLVRSKSEGNLANVKPVGYIPPSTYISPIPVRPNARSRSANRRAAQLIIEATTPKGIKSHRATSNLTFSLRHDRCRIEKPATDFVRRNSPPDFEKLHATMDDNIRKTHSKPSTVPVPFNFEKRTKSPTSSHRHLHCGEQQIEKYTRSPKTNINRRAQSGGARPSAIPTTHAAQLREELNKAKVLKESMKHENGNEMWKEDNKKRIASFLGSRSKTEEDIAIRTKEKLQKQHETTRDYMRQLVEMKQRVLNGPLIMEKQTALAQEHRLQRKFDQRMKSAKERSVVKLDLSKQVPSRRGSQGSAGTGGTFVVTKEADEVYDDDFESSKKSSSRSSHSSGSGSGSNSDSNSKVGSKSNSHSSSNSRSSSSSSSK